MPIPPIDRRCGENTHTALTKEVLSGLLGPSDVSIEEVEQLAVPVRGVGPLWATPHALVAARQLASAVRGVAAIEVSGWAGQGRDLANSALNALKRRLDGIVTEELLRGAKECPIRVRVRAGEGQVPKSGDEGAQPGIYVDTEYGGTPDTGQELTVDIAVDPIDGTTSLAKGTESVPEPPTSLLAVYKARDSLVFTQGTEVLKEVPDCFAVMGRKPSRDAHLFNAGKMWDGRKFDFQAIEAYLNALAAEKESKRLDVPVKAIPAPEMEKAKNDLRIVVHKRGKNPELIKFLRGRGFGSLSTPSDMLEQLYVVPSSLADESEIFARSAGAIDVMISHYLGSAEMAMVAVTLGSLGRHMDLSFTIDGEQGRTRFNGKTVWELNDVMDPSGPAFQVIVAARDAQDYLGLRGPSTSASGETRIEAILTAPDGAVYRITLATPAARNRLGRWGFGVFTETARNAGDASYAEELQTFNLQGTARYVLQEQRRIEDAVDALGQAVASPARRGEALQKFGRSVRGTFKGLTEDFRNSDPATAALCECANSIPRVIGARHVGAGWGGMTAVWLEKEDVPATMARIAGFLDSTDYRDKLRQKGIPEDRIDAAIDGTRCTLRLAVPGPAASVLFKEQVDVLVRSLEDPGSEETRQLAAIYGGAEALLDGEAIPSQEIAPQRYLTFLREFKTRYPNADNLVLARCGGKICVTGEHSDAHHGRSVVVPLLDDTLVAMAVDPRSANVRMGTLDESLPAVEYDPRALQVGKAAQQDLRGPEWFRYPAYNLHFLCRRVAEVQGLCLLVDGRVAYGGIPVSVGLGSSAALGVATNLAFLGLTETHLSATDLAMNVRDAELAMGMFTGLDDSFAMMGGGLCGEADSTYALDMEFMPRQDGEGRPVLKAKLRKMPEGLVAILANTGLRDPRSQLEYGLRVDESVMAACLLAQALRTKGPAFFAQFDTPQAVQKWLAARGVSGASGFAHAAA